MRKMLLGTAAAVLLAGSAVGVGVHAEDARVPCTGGPAVGGEWRASGGDLANTRTQPDEDVIDAAAAKSLQPAWVAQVGTGGSTGDINATPVVADGCLFTGTAAGDVVALDIAEQGKEVWRRHFTVGAEGLGGVIVGSTVVDGNQVVALINEAADGKGTGPYAVGLDQKTGSVLWTSEPMETFPGSYTNASPAVIHVEDGNGDDRRVVFAGWSPPEGDSQGQGGFVLIDADTGDTLVRTYTIPEADQAQGYAGGGIWSPPAYDKQSGFLFIGASNPYSKTKEHDHTNAVLKVDMHWGETFGQIVGSYKGVVDQYTEELQALSQSPVCAASDIPNGPWTFDDPACGQLDLDFGAPPNVFKVGDRTLVAALQKAGIVHVFDAETMAPVSRSVVGAPCASCNAAATAASAEGVGGVSAPGGVAFMVDPLTGDSNWMQPVAGGVHYQATTIANGVFYTFDTGGFLDVFDAASGELLAKHPMALDTTAPVYGLNSGGIAVADHTVFVAASGGSPAGQTGWIIAYQPAPAE